MLIRLPKLLVSPLQRRCFSSITSTVSGFKPNGGNVVLNPIQMDNPILNVNPRLENLDVMGKYLSGKPLLELPTSDVSHKSIDCPTTESVEVKKFIVEKPIAVKDPEAIKKRISNPLQHRVVKKHAIRMLVLRHKKMKKHQLKRLWQRMYLKFRARRIRLEKNKELEFRGRLAVKVADARKFDAEKYVDDYLTDFHTPLIPKTYKGLYQN